MEKLNISRELFGHLSDISDDSNDLSGEPRIFLLGKNSDNLIISEIELEAEGGCEYMPAINSDELLRAYLELVNKGLIPCGIARIIPRQDHYDGWCEGLDGNDLL